MRPLLCLALAFAGAFASPARAQNAGPPTISHSLAHDRLESLRDTVPQADGYARWHERDEHTVALPHFPPGQVDGAVQRSAARARGSASALAFGSSVDGVGNGFSGPNGVFNVLVAPPDTVGAVGATQYVQIVNAGLAIFDKTTKAINIPASSRFLSVLTDFGTDDILAFLDAQEQKGNARLLAEPTIMTANSYCSPNSSLIRLPAPTICAMR